MYSNYITGQATCSVVGFVLEREYSGGWVGTGWSERKWGTQRIGSTVREKLQGTCIQTALKKLISEKSFLNIINATSWQIRQKYIYIGM